MIDEKLLSQILFQIEKPGRYIGHEAGSVVKPPESVRWRVCLAFPDLYELGLSNTGLRLLYHMINAQAGAAAERTYCPWPDMIGKMRAHGLPLYSMETLTPVARFDCLGFTLQTELAYSNIVLMLGLAGVPLYSRDRSETDPLVLGGGPGTANAEPVADFFDFLIVGDAEAVLPEVLALCTQPGWGRQARAARLAQLAAVPGVYVPGRMETVSGPEGGLLARPAVDGAGRVKRRYCARLDPSLYLMGDVMPNLAPTHMRLGVEIMRGCTQGCRYCQAGYWYRPVREMDPGDVLAAVQAGLSATGLNEFGLLSLSSADYSRLDDLVRLVRSKFLSDLHINVSLPSLRADRFTAHLSRRLQDIHGNSLTFAPETGGERLRRFLNKNITDAQMLEAARICYEGGWSTVKLYFMIGIPTETLDDVRDIVRLTGEILRVGRGVHPRKSVNVNVGILSPKPFTALQWDEAADPESLYEKIRLLREGFSRLKVKFALPGVPGHLLESVLARGDRRLSGVVERVVRSGAQFDAWHEWFDWNRWTAAFDEAGVDWRAYRRRRGPDEPLAWEVVDMGVSRGYLWNERLKADRLEPTADCRSGACNACGLPEGAADRTLARSGLDPEVKEAGASAPDPADVPGRRYRFRYVKERWSRFLSHRDCLTIFEQALRRSRVRLQYTAGFHPRLKLTAGPALSMGYESVAEYLEVFVIDPVPSDWALRLNGFLPDGLSVAEGRFITPADFSLSDYTAVLTYRVLTGPELFASAWGALGARLRDPAARVPGRDGEGEGFALRDWVKAVRELEGEGFEVDLLYRHNHAALTLPLLLAHAAGLAPEQITACRVRKTAMALVRG